MWRLFQRRRSMTEPITQISARDLSSLLLSVPEKLIIFDLREQNEIDLYPYIIPGALLTTKVSVASLMPWAPPHSMVVVYATDQPPKDSSLPPLLTFDSKFHVLDGGLYAWWEARLPLESIKCLRRPSSVVRRR